MTNELVERRRYTQRDYTPEEVADAISTFLLMGGSIHRTISNLKQRWGYAPTDPTLRKWLQNSNEAMNILDQRSIANLQSNISHIIDLSYERLVSELESGNFPPNKLGTLFGIMVDKFILLNKIRNESLTKKDNIIDADQVYGDKDEEIMQQLVNDD